MIHSRGPRQRIGFCIFPGYRYCGPGCSGPGAPINAVDAACKAHDECYRIHGPSKHCDYQFLRKLRPFINSHTREARHAKITYDFTKIKTFF